MEYPQDADQPTEGNAPGGIRRPDDLRQPEPSSQSVQARYQGNRGTVTSRPSRESIVRAYSEEAAADARRARLQSQQTYAQYLEHTQRATERRQRRQEVSARSANADYATRESRDPNRAQSPAQGRPIRPLTTQESYNRTRINKEAYERERYARDSFSEMNARRTGNREIIDARGSVDSRAFNELDQLVGYSINEADKPDPLVDSTSSKSRWRSHSGSDPVRIPSNKLPINLPGATKKKGSITHLGDSISGRDSYSRPGSNAFSDIPLFVRIAVPVMIVLLIILLFIIFS